CPLDPVAVVDVDVHVHHPLLPRVEGVADGERRVVVDAEPGGAGGFGVVEAAGEVHGAPHAAGEDRVHGGEGAAGDAGGGGVHAGEGRDVVAADPEGQQRVELAGAQGLPRGRGALHGLDVLRVV